MSNRFCFPKYVRYYEQTFTVLVFAFSPKYACPNIISIEEHQKKYKKELILVERLFGLLRECNEKLNGM